MDRETEIQRLSKLAGDIAEGESRMADIRAAIDRRRQFGRETVLEERLFGAFQDTVGTVRQRAYLIEKRIAAIEAGRLQEPPSEVEVTAR